MPLVQVLIIVAVIGFIVWFLVTKIPQVEPFRQIIIWGAVIVVVVWLLTLLGLLPDLGAVRVGG